MTFEDNRWHPKGNQWKIKASTWKSMEVPTCPLSQRNRGSKMSKGVFGAMEASALDSPSWFVCLASGGVLRQDSSARILQSAVFLSQPGAFSCKFLARSHCATIWGCVLESSCFDMDAFWYSFNFQFFLCISFGIFIMFGSYVRAPCSRTMFGAFR